jgi:pyrimidine deaminase RibD-like protein
MALAVQEGKRSVEESGRGRPAPRVGVVIVGRNGDLLGSSYRGATGVGDHAEFGLLEKQLANVDLSGAKVFTTLEPCSKRSPDKTPCAKRLIDRGVSDVYIGMYDPFPTIYRAGWRMLREGGVRLHDFTQEHRLEVLHDNTAFTRSLELAVGEHGSASFDYTLNGGRFAVQAGGVEFTTQWGSRGSDSVYLKGGHPGKVASARYAASFDEVDDPRAFDYSSHFTALSVGEVGVWREGDDYLLVRVDDVAAGPSRDADHFRLDFSFEVRRGSSTSQGLDLDTGGT